MRWHLYYFICCCTQVWLICYMVIELWALPEGWTTLLLQCDFSNSIFDLAVSYWTLSNKSVQERPCLYSHDCTYYAEFAYHLSLWNICCNIRTRVLFPCPLSVYHAIKPHRLPCYFPRLRNCKSQASEQNLSAWPTLSCSSQKLCSYLRRSQGYLRSLKQQGNKYSKNLFWCCQQWNLCIRSNLYQTVSLAFPMV